MVWPPIKYRISMFLLLLWHSAEISVLLLQKTTVFTTGNVHIDIVFLVFTTQQPTLLASRWVILLCIVTSNESMANWLSLNDQVSVCSHNITLARPSEFDKSYIVYDFSTERDVFLEKKTTVFFESSWKASHSIRARRFNFLHFLDFCSLVVHIFVSRLWDRDFRLFNIWTSRA